MKKYTDYTVSSILELRNEKINLASHPSPLLTWWIMSCLGCFCGLVGSVMLPNPFWQGKLVDPFWLSLCMGWLLWVFLVYAGLFIDLI